LFAIGDLDGMGLGAYCGRLLTHQRKDAKAKKKVAHIFDESTRLGVLHQKDTIHMAIKTAIAAKKRLQKQTHQ
jgi:hypothetical protein